jgi:hypothetical protein
MITDLVALDACNLILSGYFNAASALTPSGDADGFVMRLRIDESGQIQEEWRYLLHTDQIDAITRLDALDTELRFLGWTEGVLPAQSTSGQSDVVVGSLSYAGVQQSLSQLGDERPNQPLDLFPNGLEDYLLVGNDDVYVPTNYLEALEEPWVASVTRQGNAYRLNWITRTGTPDTDLYQAALPAPDGTTAMLGKITTGGADGGPAVEQRDLYGNLLWSTNMSRSPYDNIAALATPSPDTLLVLGSTYLDLGSGSSGGADLFVAELGILNGDLRWVVQYGTPDVDWAVAMLIHDGQLYTISEVYPANFSTWTVRLNRLSLMGDLVDERILHTATKGAVKAAKVIGQQLVIAGASAGGLPDIRGWLKFISLRP